MQQHGHPYLCFLDSPVVLISSLNFSREALVYLAETVRQNAQVLLYLGLLLLLLQYLPVHLGHTSKAGHERRREEAGGAGAVCARSGR